ncbi:hypothetical protein EHM69_02675 [candidate division KSB1 bacterium]|nr:MAG: hypothetical protein EHM69_02675 [candidate division KSB1 bacterium]
MNAGYLFRAFVTGFTLLLCLSILQRVNRPSSREYDLSLSEPASNYKTSTEFDNPTDPTLSLPVEIQGFPLAAMDNTCFDGVPMDLSCYTGMLSGGRAREYTIRLHRPSSLRISLEPQDPYYDVSVVLLNSSRKCIVGLDKAGAGKNENVILDCIAPGTYRLLVGGYGEDCGPYLLSVFDQPLSIAHVSDLAKFEGRNGTVIRWKSFGEVDLAHYNLYRANQNGWSRIAVLRAHGTPADFADYRFTDRNARSGYAYRLEAVARDGRVETIPIAS